MGGYCPHIGRVLPRRCKLKAAKNMLPRSVAGVLRECCFRIGNDVLGVFYGEGHFRATRSCENLASQTSFSHSVTSPPDAGQRLPHRHPVVPLYNNRRPRSAGRPPVPKALGTRCPIPLLTFAAFFLALRRPLLSAVPSIIFRVGTGAGLR